MVEGICSAVVIVGIKGSLNLVEGMQSAMVEGICSTIVIVGIKGSLNLVEGM